MKHLLLAGLALFPLASQAAIPLNDDFAVEVDLSLASDYRTRGISQTQNDPAAQAGATLLHSSGLYAGAWTSNVDFGFGLKTRQEVDYYAGWFWQANDDISLDTGYIKYAYPKEGQFSTAFSAPTGLQRRLTTPAMPPAYWAKTKTRSIATLATKPPYPPKSA